MRLVLDILVVLVLIGILAGVALQSRHADEVSTHPEQTRSAVRRLQQEVNLHAALADPGGSVPKFPETIDPEWFGDDLPRNLVVDADRPWLEIAGTAERTQDHPKVRTTLDSGVATFWYNPNLGLVRARVAADLPDAEAVALYNLLNGCELESLYP